MIHDKAGPGYWEHSYLSAPLQTAINPTAPGWKNYVNRSLHAYFREAFASLPASNTALLEIGCANSAWLPYFVKEFGFMVYGIDYAEAGVQQAAQILQNEKVTGQVICANAFAPPEALLGKFDVVISFGVVEHFDDTAACLTAFARFLKPGGLLFTLAPNLTGLAGWIQKTVDRSTYDIHLPIDSVALQAAHARAGLEVLRCGYFLFANFGVCNLNGLSKRSLEWLLKKAFLGLLTRVFFALTWVVDTVMKWPPGPMFSPYVTCLARKSSVATG